jgi:hypothetical protein
MPGAGIGASIAPPNLSLNNLGAQPAYLGDALGQIHDGVSAQSPSAHATPAGSNSDSVNILSRIGSNEAPVTLYIK